MMQDRLRRPHVVRRLAEIQDTSLDGRPGALVTSTAAYRVGSFNHYVAATQNQPEPDTLDDERLLDAYDNFQADAYRYSTWGQEHNFAIMALATEWCLDLKREIRRRMKEPR